MRAILLRAVRLEWRNGEPLSAAEGNSGGWDSNSSVAMISLFRWLSPTPVELDRVIARYLVRSFLLQVVSHRFDCNAANPPDGKTEDECKAHRTQPPRIQRFLGQTRLDKAGDIDLLTVGVHARPVERL